MVELSRGDSGDVVAACQSDVVLFSSISVREGWRNISGHPSLGLFAGVA